MNQISSYKSSFRNFYYQTIMNNNYSEFKNKRNFSWKCQGKNTEIYGK